MALPTTIDDLREYLLNTEAMGVGENPVTVAVNLVEALQAALYRQGRELKKLRKAKG